MKIIMLMFFLLLGCSSRAGSSKDYILTFHSIWESKDIGLALKKINGLHKIEEDSEYEVYGLEDRIKMFSLSVTVLKTTGRIVSIVAPLNRGEEVSSQIIKNKIKSDDWKTYEHPRKGTDFIQLDVTEYSEKLGVGFAYDKLDKEKKTRMIYWGVNPKDIQQIL
jgi:hypothetical protein